MAVIYDGDSLPEVQECTHVLDPWTPSACYPSPSPGRPWANIANFVSIANIVSNENIVSIANFANIVFCFL